MPTITFLNAKGQILKTLEAQPNELLFDAALRAGLPVASSCTKQQVCGKCVMEIESADLPAPSSEEKQLLHRDKRKEKERISCLFHVTSSCVVKTTYW
jgi:ferredoxin